MRLTSKGQVTIPQSIRELAGLAPGCEVVFQFHNGQVFLEKVESDAALQRQRILAAIQDVSGSATTNRDLRTADILHMTQALLAAGFQNIAGKRRSRGLDLWVVATKVAMDEVAVRSLANQVLPS